MARAILKKDFVDGNKLYADELNNNFATIEAALDTMNKINWADDFTQGLTFYKGDTEAVAARDIINGQMIYDTEKQTFYLDANDTRLEMISGSVAESIVNTLEGDETGKAPSVHAVNEALASIAGTVIGQILVSSTSTDADKAYNTTFINAAINTINAAIDSKYSTSRITSGTGAPSGGNNGDIYFKY